MLFFNRKSNSIDESTLKTISKKGEKAALYPYVSTLVALQADRRMRGFEWKNIPPSEVYACGLYSDYHNSNDLKEDFIRALSVIYRHHKKNGMRLSELHVQLTLHAFYDSVIEKNKGNLPVGDLFNQELRRNLFSGTEVMNDSLQDNLARINNHLWDVFSAFCLLAYGLFLISLVLAAIPEVCLFAIEALVVTLAVIVVLSAMILCSTAAYAIAKWFETPDFTAILPPSLIHPSAPPANDECLEVDGRVYPVAQAVFASN